MRKWPSVQRRIEAEQGQIEEQPTEQPLAEEQPPGEQQLREHQPAEQRAEETTPEGGESLIAPIAKLRHRRDSFLAPLSIDELLDPVGPCVSDSGQRCSDKGFLAMPLENYLELLDWTARQAVVGKSGKTRASVPPVLQRLGLDAASWCELVSDFGKLFCTVAGRPECVDAMRSHCTHRRYHLRRRARELFALTD